MSDTDNDVDDEIIEIFVEEAGEVLESLDELVPRWRADLSDRNTLTDIRRAYHTLKGSGRMAKATELAEIAWKVEQALNKALDGSLEVTPTLVDMVVMARQEFPPLLDALSTRSPISLPEGHLMKVYARIDAVASGAVSPAPAPVQTAPSVTASSAAAAAPSTADLDALRSELKALRETINATRTGADTAASRADAARTQATEALGEARNAVARAAQADKALTGLVSRAEFERQGVQLQKLQTELSELRGQVKSLADKPAAPAGDAKPALEQRINRDITALRAENTRLQNEVSRLLKAVSESRVDTLRIAGACSLVAFVLALAASMFVK